MTVVAASRDLGLDVVVADASPTPLGAALPMLLVAAGGRWAAGMKTRARARAGVRRALGAVVALTALAIALGADSRFQTAVPGYTESLQERIERSSAADRELDRARRPRARRGADEGLRDFGAGAGVRRASASWLNCASAADGRRAPRARSC